MKTLKLFKLIDQQILAFWNTAPQERFWAYLATFPVIALVIDLIAQLFN